MGLLDRIYPIIANEAIHMVLLQKSGLDLMAGQSEGVVNRPQSNLCLLPIPSNGVTMNPLLSL